MSQNHSNKNEEERPQRRKRRWLRRLFFAGLLLTLLIGIAQGPGLRFFGTKAIAKGLDSAGLKGTFTLEGSLFSGIELRSVNLTGNGVVRELQADSLSVDYRLTELIHGKIDIIRGNRIHIWVDITGNQSPEVDTTKEKDKSKTPPNLEKIRQLVLPIRLDIQNSSVKISKGDLWLWQAKDTTITHDTGAEDFHLTLGQFMDMDEKVINHQDVVLSWGHNLTSIKNFPIRTDTLLTHVICSWDGITPKHIEAQINWRDGDFAVNLDNLKTIRVSLTQGEINLEKFGLIIGHEGEIGGKITQLHLSVADVMAPPTTMQAKLKIAGDKLRWQDRQVQHLAIQSALSDAHIELDTQLITDKEKASELRLLATLATPEHSTDSDLAHAWATCWHDLKAELELTIPEPRNIALWSDAATPTGGWPTGKLHLFCKGSLIGKSPGDATAQIQWTSPQWAKLKWHDLHLTGKWDHKNQEAAVNLKASQLAGGEVSAFGKYNINTHKYQGNASIKTLDIAKLRRILTLFKLKIPRAGIINLTWDGEGHGPDINSYLGNLDTEITGLEIEPDGSPTTDIALTASYAKNLQVDLKKLQVNRDKLKLNAQGSWKDQLLNISQLELHDQQRLLIDGNANIPLSREIKDLESFRNQAGKINLDLRIKNLPIADIYKQLPHPTEPTVSGNFTSTLAIKGTLKEPTIDFKCNAQQLKLIAKKDIPKANIDLNLITTDGKAQLNGTIKPDGHQPIVIHGNIPFHLDQWINSPESILEEPLQAIIDTRTISLAPFAKYLPHFNQMKGTVSTKIEATGTVGSPKIKGDSRLKITHLNSVNQAIPDLKNLDIKLNFTEKMIVIEPSTCVAAGGQYELQGKVDLKEITNPEFNITLSAKEALLWRDDKMIIRADANLKLSGPYKKAEISGDVGLVQSIFYKDIQIVPIGTTGSSPALPGKAKLPSFTAPVTSDRAPDSAIPKPFGDWTLDLRIQTKEDILIKGNLAQGNVTGNITIKGTLASPAPKGKAILVNAEASLPFSRLHVKKGEVVFSPKTGFDPTLNMKATSRVGSTDVEITVYGQASNPKLILSSSPPLPENEIVFLLASGSTSDRLSDSTAATGKAFQLLLDTWLRSSPGKMKILKSLVSKLNKVVNINIGATDQFTGREYNSANIKIHDRWYFIASIDQDNNSRGILLYTIRFK